jgi:hypothetical protein
VGGAAGAPGGSAGTGPGQAGTGGAAGSGTTGSAGSAGGSGLFALSGRYNFSGTSLCDVNGDGHLDLVGAAGVWKGNGDGTFNVNSVVSTNTLPGASGVGDFDGDGRCDLLEFNLSSTTVTAGFNPGQTDATFGAATATTYGLPPLSPGAPLWTVNGITDINGDGRQDILMVSDTTGGKVVYLVFLGQPPGSDPQLVPVETDDSWVANVAAVTASAGDVDGDGHPDIAIAADITGHFPALYIVYGLGNGHFDTSRTTLVTSDSDYPLAIVDLDGDGKVDLIVDNVNAGQDQIYWNLGGGSFAPGPMVPFGYAGDFNGDGKPDLFANSNGGSQYYLNDGARGFEGPVQIPFFHWGFVGDLDGDGATDLVMASPTDPYPISVFLSTAKHPGPAMPDIHCGTLTPAQCAGPSGF